MKRLLFSTVFVILLFSVIGVGCDFLPKKGGIYGKYINQNNSSEYIELYENGTYYAKIKENFLLNKIWASSSIIFSPNFKLKIKI